MSTDESAPWWVEAREEERPDFETTESGIPVETLHAVLDRDHHQCQNCGEEEDLHPHHVVFRSLGGSHEPENLVTVCWRCHARIHDGELRVKRIDGVWYFGRRDDR